MTKLTKYDVISELFEDRLYNYFLTIKPHPDKVDAMADLLLYLDRRLTFYWIVKCVSNTGYVHYHGIMSFSQEQQHCDLLKKAIHRKVNRCIGFLFPLEKVRSVFDTYMYITSEKNNAQAEYLKDNLHGFCECHDEDFMMERMLNEQYHTDTPGCQTGPEPRAGAENDLSADSSVVSHLGSENFYKGCEF